MVYIQSLHNGVHHCSCCQQPVRMSDRLRRNYPFLKLLSSTTPQQARALICTATEDQIYALMCECLSKIKNIKRTVHNAVPKTKHCCFIFSNNIDNTHMSAESSKNNINNTQMTVESSKNIDCHMHDDREE